MLQTHKQKPKKLQKLQIPLKKPKRQKPKKLQKLQTLQIPLKKPQKATKVTNTSKATNAPKKPSHENKI